MVSLRRSYVSISIAWRGARSRCSGAAGEKASKDAGRAFVLCAEELRDSRNRLTVRLTSAKVQPNVHDERKLDRFHFLGRPNRKQTRSALHFLSREVA